MISFEMPEKIQQTVTLMTMVAENMMRPVARYFDDHEHEIPWDYINFMHDANKQMGGGGFVPSSDKPKKTNGGEPKKEGPRLGYQRLAFSAEILSWGDTGLYLCSPVGLLGAAAVAATGTAEQKQRFLARFAGEKPVFDAMALTEPHAGSAMPAMVRTTAVRADDSWVLNGEKIFVTAGHKALVDTPGFIVVWATIDPSAGRAGVRPFVVEAGTPGCTVTKLEHKLGIRASDTASVVLQDCRIPFTNILGSPEVEKKTTEGFKGAMATFDASRPMVAASALGVARATLEALKEFLAQKGIEIRYGLPRSRLTSIEREMIDMEVMLHSSWLLVLKSVWMMDEKKPNNLEASMGKVRAGDVVVKMTQKAVEMLGPVGYSREHLLEKWFRDAKINDLYEGTGQINRLIVARRILEYGRDELS
ncbi:MAG: acyl-CoA dehydrogenase [Gammaproteobacteria bacterium RBG_16_66_13]|nr:MAG: acyl-CoA dehydrogenase [Gammaproteobacteria bacterium RBG_16_66_13]